MQIQSINRQSFGWNTQTHIGMTLLALRDSGLEPEDMKQLAKYSVMPDFVKSEEGYHHNTHFFYPYGKDKSFGRGGNEGNNAFDFSFLCSGISEGRDKAAIWNDGKDSV